jgi:hypothetical protein
VQLWYGTLVSETPGIVGIQVIMAFRKDHILLRVDQDHTQLRFSHTLFQIGTTQKCAQRDTMSFFCVLSVNHLPM